jgi:WD40 repeat protein
MLALKGAYGDVNHLTFAPDGKLLAASGGGRGLEMWELPSGTKWPRYPAPLRPNDAPVAFHPSRSVCLASRGLYLIEINTETRGARQLSVAGKTTYGGLQTWAALPDRSGVICHVYEAHGSDGTLRLLRWAPGEQLNTIWAVEVPKLAAHSSQAPHPLVVCAAPDGATFITLDAKPNRSAWAIPTELTRVSVWTVERGQFVRSAKLPANTAPVLALAPDARTFVTCRANALSVWNAAGVEVVRRIVRNDTRAHFTALAFHPSGKYLAATSNDATVRFYDTTTWEVSHSFDWKIGRLRSAAFSPDGTLAAVGSEMGEVVVWDVDL